MREVLKVINNFKDKERGCVPNLRGASPVGRDKGDRSYVARTVSRSGDEVGDVVGGGQQVVAAGRAYSGAIKLPGGEPGCTTRGARPVRGEGVRA